jgi:hypothetical protein
MILQFWSNFWKKEVLFLSKITYFFIEKIDFNPPTMKYIMIEDVNLSPSKKLILYLKYVQIKLFKSNCSID